MKRIYKHILSALLIFSIATPVLHAKQITPETARQNASDFFAKTKSRKVKGSEAISASSTLTLAQTVKDAKSTPLFYIFSRGDNNGFVIASADEPFCVDDPVQDKLRNIIPAGKPGTYL